MLFQFPESFHYTNDNRIYLAKLIAEFEGFPVMIEFRHKEWIRESVFEGLEKRKAGIVFCDMPQLKNLPDGIVMKTPFIGSNAYIRLHDRNEGVWYQTGGSPNGSARYCYDYSDEELAQFIPIIKQAKREWKKVHFKRFNSSITLLQFFRYPYITSFQESAFKTFFFNNKIFNFI